MSETGATDASDSGAEDDLSAHWTEAELLSEGFAANPSTLHAIQFRARLTNEEAAQLCGVSLRTYRRWLINGKPNAGCVRLLAVLAGYVPWDAWQGWEIHQGFLFPPGYTKHGMAPGEFFAVPFYRQSIAVYRQRVEELERQVEKHQRALEKFRNSNPPSRKLVMALT